MADMSFCELPEFSSQRWAEYQEYFSIAVATAIGSFGRSSFF
jgi:hypothetical protein